MTPVSATEEQFTAFLTKYGYIVDGDTSPLLALSHAFLLTLPLSESADSERVVEAQCFIAYAISENGGGFNPAAIAEAKTLVKSGLGRSAIVDEWKINELLSGTDPLSLLRSIPLAYGLLKEYLVTATVGVFVV